MCLSPTRYFPRCGLVYDQIEALGDAALLGPTVKFDSAQLDSPFKIIRPSSASSDMMVLPENVRTAINLAYANIHMFQRAQSGETTLKVDSETMPSVVYSRSAYPIASVGLYVLGGRGLQGDGALDSGASGRKCSISRVIYVAKLVGASLSSRQSTQAVGAPAYGTETIRQSLHPGRIVKWPTQPDMYGGAAA